MTMMKIIDIHTHVGDLLYGRPLTEPYERTPWTFGAVAEWTGFKLSKPPLGSRTVSRYLEIIHAHQRNNLATADNLRRFAREAGVTHSVILPIEPLRRTDENLALCREDAARGRANPRLFTFASVDPRDPERIARLHRYMPAGCLGLKIHPIVQDLPLTDPAWFEIAEELARYRKPILIHSGKSSYYIPNFKRRLYGDAKTFEKLIAAFPEQAFILGHCNLYEPEVVWDLGRRYPNVYADTSFQSAQVIRTAFAQLGEDRVLYASDFPFSRPQYAVRTGLKACAGRSALAEKFFARNAEALIGTLPELENG
jgi:uncharacterized protein